MSCIDRSDALPSKAVMDDITASEDITSNIDYSLKSKLDEVCRTRLKDQQNDLFFDRLLSARRYVDQLFHSEFGLSAYPYLDILLIGRNAGADFGIETICESLAITPNIASRHLAVMLTMGLLEHDGLSYRSSSKSNDILIDIVENNLSNAFSIID